MSKKKASKLHGRAIVQPATLDLEKREVVVVFATETPVFRWGWDEDYDEVLSCEDSAIRMERVNKGLPVLDAHNSWSVFSQVGRSSDVWINENKEVCARLRFSKRAQVDELFKDIADGIVTDISVGYRVYKYVREPQEEGKNPIYRAVDWMPTEISLAPVPADINSGVRSADKDNEIEIINLSHNPKRRIMGKKAKSTTPSKGAKTKKRNEEGTIENGVTIEFIVQDEAVSAGDVIVIDEVEYVALANGEVGDTIELAKVEPAEETPEEETPEEETPEEETIETEEGRNLAQRALDKRLKAILVSTRAAKLPDSVAIEMHQSGKPLAEVRQEIIKKAAGSQKAVNGNHGARIGLEAIEKKRTAMQDAILHRVYPSVFKLEDASREFRGMTLVEMGKELLTERGVSVRGLDKTGVANLVFGRTHSSSDFPILFEGAIDKMLRADYNFAPEFWDKIARQTTVTDFRAKNLYQVESTNGMAEVAEGAEIKYTTLKEGKSSIRVKSFAEGIKFTRQAFINDDLNALAIIPSRFVKDWDELRGDLVWDLIIKNVEMADGKNLFSTDHKNLLSGATSVLSEAGLEKAMILLKQQTGADGKRRIRVVPQYLIVPSELEVSARKLMTAITASNTKDVNVFAGVCDVIVEPRLTNASEWYLSADPNAIDTLYYAYLEGNETLRVNTEDDFSTDSMKYAVRGDFGSSAIDHRGLVKSAGK